MVASISWLASHQDLKSTFSEENFTVVLLHVLACWNHSNEVTLNLMKYVHRPDWHFHNVYLILINRFITHVNTHALNVEKMVLCASFGCGN